MKKINILFLYSSKGFGGIVRNLSILVNNLNHKTFNIFVVSLANKEDSNSDVKLDADSKAAFYRIDERRRLDFKAMRELKYLLNTHNIDILSCHGYKADIYGFILRKFYKCNIKLVTMAHGWVTPGVKIQLYYALDKLAIRCFDSIVAVSEGLCREMLKYKIPSRKIAVINNGINAEAFKRTGNRNLFRERLDLSKEDFLIGFIGRLSREKNIETVMLSFRDVLSSFKNAKFLITGDGPERKRLEKLSIDLRMVANVKFIGFQENTREIYSILDLYVSASLKEGLPNSILEAQVVGVPCIAADIAGNSDIIKDGVNGFLFKPKDHNELSRKIATLLKDKELAGKFVSEGQKIIKAKFSVQERIARLEGLYQKIAARNK